FGGKDHAKTTAPMWTPTPEHDKNHKQILKSPAPADQGQTHAVRSLIREHSPLIHANALDRQSRSRRRRECAAMSALPRIGSSS
ncbi:hypothetical protein, partial [Phytohabitans aurantiacus]|uniref:hypothetical protein n=1 Tax=Phytohabitans aurantiacus TaxID=3016789 RepID=UPI002491AAE2